MMDWHTICWHRVEFNKFLERLHGEYNISLALHKLHHVNLILYRAFDP